jgi:hypothetical protein
MSPELLKALHDYFTDIQATARDALQGFDAEWDYMACLRQQEMLASAIVAQLEMEIQQQGA